MDKLAAELENGKDQEGDDGLESIENLLDEVNNIEGIGLSEEEESEDSIGLRKNTDPWDSGPNLKPKGRNLTDLPTAAVDTNFILLSEEKGSIESKLQEKEEELSKIQSENQKLYAQKEQVELEKQKLKKKLAQSPRAVDGDEEYDLIDIRDRFSESRKEVARLKKRIEELEHEIRTKDSKQQAVQLKIDRQHKKEVEQLEKEVKRLTADLSESDNLLQDFETDLEIANTRIEELEEQNEALKNLYNETRENLTGIQSEQTDEMTRMTIDHMQQQAELLQQREELELQYNEIEEQYRELERRHKELEERDNTNVSQINERSDEIDKLQKLLDNKEEQLKEGVGKMVEEKRQMKEIISEQEDQIMDCHEKLEFLRMENESLTKEIQENSKDDMAVQGLMVKELEAQRDRLQRQLDERAAEIEDLKNQASLRETEETEYGDMIADLQRENTSLQRQNSEMKVKLSRLSEIDSLKSEIATKKELVNKVKEELRASKEENTTMKERYESLVESKLSLICNISNNIDSMREDLINSRTYQMEPTRTIIQRESFTDWVQTQTAWLFTSIS